MRIAIAIAFTLLAGCSTLDQVGKNAGLTCVSSPGWNGAPVLVLYANVDKGVSGTAGGEITIDCGALGKASFKDSGKAAVPTVPKAP